MRDPAHMAEYQMTMTAYALMESILKAWGMKQFGFRDGD